MRLKLGLLLTSLLLSLVPLAAQDDLTGVNCAVTPDQVLGQANTGFAGMANSGFAGMANSGFAGMSVQEFRESGFVLDPASLVTNLQYSSTGNQGVAILVVDDFASDAPETDADWETASHGWYTLNILVQMQNALPSEVAQNILIETIDVSALDYRSDLMRTEIESTVASIRSSTGIQNFVVNMSFVFVACDDGTFNHQRFIDRHENNANYSLVEEAGGDLNYALDVRNNSAVNRVDANGFDLNNNANSGPPSFVATQLTFLNLFEDSQLQSDTLRDYFRDRKDYTLIPVASAGNFKWKRPFFPARWAEVISVSATMGGTSDLWAQSNDGEISAPGAWVEFGDEYFSAGTSYAAPIASMMIALDLTQGSPTCGLQGNAPELASNGRNNNVPLLDAVNDRC